MAWAHHKFAAKPAVIIAYKEETQRIATISRNSFVIGDGRIPHTVVDAENSLEIPSERQKQKQKHTKHTGMGQELNCVAVSLSLAALCCYMLCHGSAFPADMSGV